MESSTERRRALVLLDEQLIANILGLPEGVRVIGIRDDFARLGVMVMVEGDSLDPVPEGVEPPRLRGEWEYLADEQRVRYTSPFAG